MVNSSIDLYNLFRERAEAVSTKVIRVDDYLGASRALTEIIGVEKAVKIVADPSPMVTRCVHLLESNEVLEVAGESGRSREKSSAVLFFKDLRRQSEDADIGISEMITGVAETGSLVGDCTSMANRLVSTLPPVHVVLMPALNIVATPGEAIKNFYGKGSPPGYLSFITGPSRTADIERVLTIGVHGPEKLYVILVDDIGGGSSE